MIEGELLVVFYLSTLLQIFSQLCFCLKDLIKIAILLLASVSIHGSTEVSEPRCNKLNIAIVIT